MDFTKRPYVEYTYSDNIEVKPIHFQNAKILWRPQRLESDKEMRQKRANSKLSYAESQPTFVFPFDYQPSGDQLHDLRDVIDEKVPN